MSLTIAVIGATGLQGGATVRALLARGQSVRALVRDPASAAARAVESVGAELVVGDLDEPDTLGPLLEGVRGLFSVLLTAPPTDAEREIRQARALIAAAEAAGVTQLVHSSVSGWLDDSARALAHDEVYWRGKDTVDALVRRSSIDVTTIIRPALFMDNFLPPRLDRMFPEHAEGLLAAATGATTPLPLTATADIGDAAAAAFADPRRFAWAEIELAGDVLTFTQVAEAMGLRYEQRHPEALADRAPSWLGKQLWFEAVNHRARPEHSAPYGLRPRSFGAFLAERR
ncbi:NmrA family NAD(P)-binding protein [Microbacteriaceae bacterium VKM Ac-2855]|nr:NmrA family NAD(P)-binding protein [Microbacteriaceae bacterium VKM Ac-2855]